MTKIARCVLSVGSALILIVGCNAGAAPRERTIKTFSEPDGRRHPVDVDVNANGVVTCIQAEGKAGDGGCSIRDVSGVPTFLKGGGSMTVSGAGKTTFTCTGTGALYCSASIKD